MLFSILLFRFHDECTQWIVVIQYYYQNITFHLNVKCIYSLIKLSLIVSRCAVPRNVYYYFVLNMCLKIKKKLEINLNKLTFIGVQAMMVIPILWTFETVFQSHNQTTNKHFKCERSEYRQRIEICSNICSMNTFHLFYRRKDNFAIIKNQWQQY